MFILQDTINYETTGRDIFFHTTYNTELFHNYKEYIWLMRTIYFVEATFLIRVLKFPLASGREHLIGTIKKVSQS